jgi:hypothetical protein
MSRKALKDANPAQADLRASRIESAAVLGP